MKQYVYGRNVALERMKQSSDVLHAYVMKGDELLAQFQKKKVPFTIKTRQELDSMAGSAKHQGVVLEVLAYEFVPLEKMLATPPKGQYPLYVMLDGLEDPHNLGAILRTCDVLQVDGVIIGKNRSVGLTSTVAKVSAGAIDHVPVAQVTNLTRTIKDMQKDGFWVVGTCFEKAQDYRTIDYQFPCIVVIGSEGSGISRLVLEQCDYRIKIPMKGHVNSLNASVATAVVLYQIEQSRYPL